MRDGEQVPSGDKLRFHQSLLRKQSLITTAILVLGLLVIAGFYNFSTMRYFREQTEIQAKNVLRQTQASLEDKITQFQNLIGLMYLNPDLQNLLFNEYYYDVPALVASRQITTFFAPVDNQLGDLFTDVTGIAIYTTNPTLRMLPGQLEPIVNVSGETWYTTMEQESVDRTVWMLTQGADGGLQLSAVHRLRNLRISSFSANFLGYIKLDFALDRFFQNVLISAEDGSDLFLVTGADQRAIAGSRLLDGETLISQLFENGSVEQGKEAAPTELSEIAGLQRRTLRMEGSPFVAWGIPVKGTQWTCWYAVSEQAMMDALRRVNLPVLLVLIGMTGAMVAAALFTTSRWTRRIGRLAQAMEALEGGAFTVRVQDRGDDEIGFLSDGFNNMATRLGELVKREYLARMRQREYDLSALQAQLHPHFLYNTLASISWLGMQGGMPEIPAISNALARFYRLSLSKGKHFIRVDDEVKQVAAYLEIMGIRYKDKIVTEFLVSEDVAGTWTLKLILQPFVENAILHGLSAQKSRIHITVAAEREEDMLVFTVADDGVGIPEERMPQILAKNTGATLDAADMVEDDTRTASAEGGYGIVNVDERIQTYFGDPYGLTISSTVGLGTVVTIRVPLLHASPKES